MTQLDGKKIIGIGSPVVDMLARVSEEHLAAVGGLKGGMELVEPEMMEQLIEKIEHGSLAHAAGGSAANTIFALARLETPAGFLGKIGNDEQGRYYQRDFGELGGDCSRFKFSTDVPTARCLSLVTPDSERTMRTCLGAAATLTPEEITDEDFIGYTHAHLEGYLLFNRELIQRVLKTAKKAGCKISLDLAAPEIVEAASDILPELLKEYVDIVFANETEAAVYADTRQPDEALQVLSKVCDVAAVKLGAEGALIRQGNVTHRIPVSPVHNVTDTTGAGDYWAAGFLYGYIRDYPLDICGKIGSLLGGEVVQHMGADLPQHTWKSITEQIMNVYKV